MTRIPGRALLLALIVVGCGGGESGTKIPATTAGASAVQTLTVRDTTISTAFEAAGVAEPIERATLSTKLTGSVTEVLVREGDPVNRGQLLARIDARDVEAKRAQVDAGIAAAEAVYQDARTQADRFRALYADSAATRYQVEQVETGLARADAGLRTARASRAELDAMGAYSEIRAPFNGIVTQRFVDPGAFAAPGGPIVEVQDASRLRVSVTVPPRVAAALRKGMLLDASIEDRPVPAILEGAVPAATGAVYTVNAIVQNPKGEFLPGSAATIRIPDGTRSAILIPASALVQEGDLTGVRVKTGTATELRWVKTTEHRASSTEGGGVPRGPRSLLPASAPMIEVFSGLMAGDVIVVGSH